jgi:hypothetical protein
MKIVKSNYYSYKNLTSIDPIANIPGGIYLPPYERGNAGA